MIHTEILQEDTKILLDKIKIEPKFYLSGGTALALQIGHRQSEDLDFFSKEDFNPDLLLVDLRKYHQIEATKGITDGTFIGRCDNVKISFMRYVYPIENFIKYNAINIASIEDITGMKLNAISRRNTKRDFVDLYYIIKNKNYSFDDLVEIIKTKLPGLSFAHIFYSLTYFEEANENPDIIWMKGFEVEWNTIKDFFINFVQKDIKKFI